MSFPSDKYKILNLQFSYFLFISTNWDDDKSSASYNAVSPCTYALSTTVLKFSSNGVNLHSNLAFFPKNTNPI